MSKVYFDYASTTAVDEEALNIFSKVSIDYFMNNSNDKESQSLLDDSKKKILNLLNIDNYEVTFTSGGTEANNLGILGKFGKSYGKHFITSKIEHPSILETFKYLESIGNHVDYVGIDEQGKINENEIYSLIRKNTVMVCIMMVNNEIGTVNNINNIFTNVKNMNVDIVTMTDAVQALGRINISMNNVDMVTFSAHKIYGLKGIGALVSRKEIFLEQHIHGSKGSLRPGTSSLGLIVSFVKVFKEAVEEQKIRYEAVQAMQSYFLDKVNYNFISLNAEPEIGIVSLNLKVNALAETISLIMYDLGVVISTRAACSQKSNTRSHVLTALGLSNDIIDKTIRVSFSHKTSEDEVDKLVNVLDEMCNRFK